MKKATLYCCLLLSFSMSALGQNRQVVLTSGNDNIVINDSRVDTAGNIISVGLEWQLGGFISNCIPIAIKTTKNGTRIWTRSLNYTGARALKVRIAANGDYLILAKDNWPILWRLSPSGTKVFADRYTYTHQVNDYITGVTELSNHQIAICGFNDFTYGSGGGGSGYILKGYFIHIDSVGNTIAAPTGYSFTLQTYGYDHSSGNQNEMTLNDVACIGDKLYFVGSYKPTIGGIRGMVIRTDLYGYNPVYYITSPTISHGGGTAPAVPFSSINAIQGRLYVSAFFNNSSTTQSYMIGQLDTTSFAVSGVELHVNNQTLPYAQSFIRDTSNWYYAIQPGNNNIFAGRITNGAVAQNRSIHQDTSIALYGMAVSGDTAIYSGLAWMGSYNAGFLASYNMAAPAAALCGVTDTSVLSSPCSISMSALAGPAASQRSLSSFSTIAAGPTTCAYDLHLCGTAPCSTSGMASSIYALSLTSVCPGDTVRLVRMATCNRMVWYRDTVRLPNKDTLVIATDTFGKGAGRYYIVLDNGICADTSAVITVNVYPAPITPGISQSRDTLFSMKGAAYQWFDSGLHAIGRARSDTFRPGDSGWYYVRVTDSNGCSATSAAYHYLPPADLLVSGFSSPGWSIYPNPTTSSFTVEGQGGNFTITISDHIGRRVASWVQRGSRQLYDVSDLALSRGVYMISITSKGVSERYKLLVLGVFK